MARSLREPLLVRRTRAGRRRTDASRGRARSSGAAPGLQPRARARRSSRRSCRRPRLSSTQPAARAFLTQFRSPYGRDEPPLAALFDDRHGRRPELPRRAPRHGEEVRARTGESEPRERTDERRSALSATQLVRYGFGVAVTGLDDTHGRSRVHNRARRVTSSTSSPAATLELSSARGKDCPRPPACRRRRCPR